MRSRPLAAFGPWAGVLAADLVSPFAEGAHGEVVIDVVLFGLLGMVVIAAAQHRPPGVSPMLGVFGALAVGGGLVVAVMAAERGDGAQLVAAARHLTVGLYCWAAIAVGQRRVKRRLAPARLS